MRTQAPEPARRRLARRCAIGFVLPLAVSLLACGEESSRVGTAPVQAVAVEVTPVVTRTLAETVRGIGTLQALQRVEIRPDTNGRVRAIAFTEGQAVAAGDLLYQLDVRKLEQTLAAQQAALAAAQARLDNAQRKFEVISQLYARNAATPDEFQEAQTDVEAARAEVDRVEAELALARERLADTRIVAPFAGVTSESLVDVGAYIEIGDVLTTLYMTSVMEIAFTLPERYMGRLSLGQPVALTVAAYPERSFAGELSFVSPNVNETTRDILVKAEIANDEGLLKPGAFGTAVLTVDVREDRPVVSASALVATREGYVAFVVGDDGRAQRRSVTIGLRQPDVVEIVDGLLVGEQVVTAGQLAVSDATPVRVVSRGQAPRQSTAAGLPPDGPAGVDQASSAGT